MLQWKSNEYYIFYVSVCSFRYPACNALAPYRQSMACPALQNFFPTLSHKMKDFRKINIVTKLKMSVLIFSTNMSSVLLRKKEARYDEICVLGFMWSIGYSCQFLINLDFFSTDFRKIGYQISWNPTSGCRVVAVWRTDGQTNRQAWRS